MTNSRIIWQSFVNFICSITCLPIYNYYRNQDFSPHTVCFYHCLPLYLSAIKYWSWFNPCNNGRYVSENTVDLVAFVYAHFPPEIRKKIHQKAIKWLKPGGKILLEVFNPAQLKNTSGGPQDLSMLYTAEMLADHFTDLDIELLQTEQTVLKQGRFHEGKADIIRFAGIKNSLNFKTIYFFSSVHLYFLIRSSADFSSIRIPISFPQFL